MALDLLLNSDTICPTWRSKINDLITAFNSLTASTGQFVPVGGIIDWYGYTGDTAIWDVNGVGLTGTEMANFALCQGQALTGCTVKSTDGSGVISNAPDLRGKFTVGKQSSDADFAEIGNTGGEKEVTLTSAQSGLPASHISLSFGGAISYSSGSSGGNSPQNGGSTNYDIAAMDAAEPHDNIPPFYVTAKIIRYK